jgi:hypothetical protein
VFRRKENHNSQSRLHAHPDFLSLSFSLSLSLSLSFFLSFSRSFSFSFSLRARYYIRIDKFEIKNDKTTTAKQKTKNDERTFLSRSARFLASSSLSSFTYSKYKQPITIAQQQTATKRNEYLSLAQTLTPTILACC